MAVSDKLHYLNKILKATKHVFQQDIVSTQEAGVDAKMKYKINRRVTINGKTEWIHASTEQEYANKILALQSPMHMTFSGEKHNFEEYAMQWFHVYSTPNISTATATTYSRQLNNYILPAFGNMAIEDVSTVHIQKLFNSISGAKATKDKVKIVLNQIFESAIDDGMIFRNPLKSARVRIEGSESKETRPYTVTDMRYLAAHLRDIQKTRDKCYLALQMFHPLRLEEVLGLRWGDIDFLGNKIYVRRAVTHPTRSYAEVKEPKTPQSKRIIGMSTKAADILLAAQIGPDDDYILGGSQPLSYTQVRRMCERIRRDVCFSQNITPIRFRTTVLTDIYDQTKDVKLTQQSAGHASPAMTLKHYIKGREDVGCSAKALDRLYSD